ncbi:hypothetical protein ACTXT7_008853 [Hymenolepis weldensis]
MRLIVASISNKEYVSDIHLLFGESLWQKQLARPCINDRAMLNTMDRDQLEEESALRNIITRLNGQRTRLEIQRWG